MIFFHQIYYYGLLDFDRWLIQVWSSLLNKYLWSKRFVHYAVSDFEVKTTKPRGSLKKLNGQIFKAVEHLLVKNAFCLYDYLRECLLYILWYQLSKMTDNNSTLQHGNLCLWTFLVLFPTTCSSEELSHCREGGYRLIAISFVLYYGG